MAAAPEKTPSKHANLPPDMQAAMELQGKVFAALTGGVTVNLAALGDHLGIYTAMKEGGSMTSTQLASKLKLDERFLREWLYAQASAGFVTADDKADKFHLSIPQQMVLANEDGPDASPFFSAGMLQTMAHLPRVDRLSEAFRSGRGWTFDEMGAASNGLSICGTCRFLGVWVRHNLVNRLSGLPGMHEKLEAGIKIADVGCGAAESLMTLAKAFPKCTYHGYDISQRSLDLAAQRQKDLGLEGIDMAFLNPDKGDGLPDAPTYDLILTMDAVHDMARPDQVMPLIRKAVKPEGAWLVFDIKGAGPNPVDNITDPEGRGATFYGISVHACLASGLSEEGGLGLGTLGWQEPVARRMAAEAGFSRFEVLDFEHPMNNIFWIQP